MEFISFWIILCFNILIIKCQWIPNLPDDNQPDLNQFHLYESKILQNALSKFDEKDLEWITVGTLSIKTIQTSYIIYGANKKSSRNSASGYTKDLSFVIMCKVKLSDIKIEHVSCEKLQDAKTNDSFLLGSSIKTLSLINEGVIVYCDPLWHHYENISQPSGKCFVKIIDDQDQTKTKQIEFCKVSSTIFRRCMGGFSIDLYNSNNKLSGIKMIAGMPFAFPYGAVTFVTKIFTHETPIFINPPNDVGNYFNFGYDVAIDIFSNGFASSPLSVQYGPNVTDVQRPNVRFTSPDNVPFSSFGLTIETLSIEKGTKSAIVISAPYYPVKSLANVGKVYMFCLKNQKVVMGSNLEGKQKDEYFGYSLTNIGDIDGDGNEDLAVSSPFLNTDDTRGRISIYRVNSNCEVDEKPIQIIKSDTKIPGLGIFSLAVSGKTDIDHNTWPDILVSNSQKNSINIYASRARYTAQCRVMFETDYTISPLNKGAEVPIRVTITLRDPRQNLQANISKIFQSFKIKSQINLSSNNSHLKKSYFELIESKMSLFKSRDSLQAFVSLKAKIPAEEMDLRQPITIAYRLVEDCSKDNCHNRLYPLIDWSSCLAKIPISKYFCLNMAPCESDLSVELIDKASSNVEYNYIKSYQRDIELSITNNGPTEAKDIRFILYANQNLRINKATAARRHNLKTKHNPNNSKLEGWLSALELDKESTVNISINVYFDHKENMSYNYNYLEVEVESGVVDKNLTNNKMKMEYTFVYSPNISFTASSVRDTVIDSRNRSSYISPGQRVGVDMIGPRLSQVYSIDNIGRSEIYNISVRVSLPIRAVSEESYMKQNEKSSRGLNILYLFDKIRGVNNNSELKWLNIKPQVSVTGDDGSTYPCSMPEKYTNQLDIIAFERHASHLVDIHSNELDDIKRQKRSINYRGAEETEYPDEDFNPSKEKLNRYLTAIIRCGKSGMEIKSVLCADIICTIPVIKANNGARFQINAWLWAYTFFKKQISDIMIYSSIKLEFGNPPDSVILKLPSQTNFAQHQRVLFTNVKSKITHRYMIWPIIVGLVIGILILAILIVALYKCGFFSRSKRRRPLSSRSSSRVKSQPTIVHQYDNLSSS